MVKSLDLNELTGRLLDRVIDESEPRDVRAIAATKPQVLTLNDIILKIVRIYPGLESSRIIRLSKRNKNSITAQLSKLTKLGEIKRAKNSEGIYHYFDKDYGI